MPSPWINELEFNRKHQQIDSDQYTDVTIVGAGIAGISTCFFTLENTNLDVILIDAFKIAHGATGHNAGQVVGYFERPFNDLAQEYGLEKAVQAQKEILKGWDLIDKIISITGIKINYEKFWGWAGCQNMSELIPLLENDYLRNISGFDLNNCYIDKDWPGLKDIPKHLENTYTTADKSFILEKLNTNNKNYIACLGSQKGVLNSAIFCEKIVNYLLNKFPKRFKIYEHSKVEEINLKENLANLKVRKYYVKKDSDLQKYYEIKTRRIVLCTNGFKDFKINLDNAKNFDSRFKRNLSGLIGFMAGYLSNEKISPTAITYFLPELESPDIEHPPYFYLTRRKYSNKNQTLTCIGGPDFDLQQNEHYDRDKDYSNDETFKVTKFLHKYYKHAPKGDISFDFKWQGLMGYTQNRIRLIGPEKENPNLLYNLGCNGIGILPSIYGGYKISQFLQGKRLEESIFDPSF